jgi:ATP-dependent protease HslVU (ClpYQ) peptidase subunit
MRKDVVGLGRAMTQTFLSCGSGGGYAVVAAETMIEGAIKIKVKF